MSEYLNILSAAAAAAAVVEATEDKTEPHIVHNFYL